jgi:hypothetical protein
MSDKPADSGRLSDESSLTGTGVKRPLVPLVLALMLGLTAAAWGFKIPGTWLAIGLAGLLAVLGLLYGRGMIRGSKGRVRNGPDDPTESARKTDSEP